jgi:Protein tyrosine and serine/threonine kinase
LEKPFRGFTIEDMRTKVINGESRPKVNESWPQLIKELLKKCWHKDWKERYNFPMIEETLRKELVKARQGDDSGLDHNQRRSTFVFQLIKGLSDSSFFRGTA